MRHYLQALLWILVLMVLGSCELAKIGDPIVVSDVEEEFYIDPIEKLGPLPRTLQFQIQTIEVEPCINAVIDIEVIKSGNNLNISLKDILSPDDCIPGETNALAQADMGNLLNGFYNLGIDLKKTVFNEGQLNIFEDRYSINMESTNGFTLLHSNLLRVPNASIWGYVTYQEAADEGISQMLIEELASKSQIRTYNNGYYGHFQVTDNGAKVDIKNAPSTTRLQSFLFEYKDEKETLQELADRYQAQFGDKIEFRIFTAEGDVF